jgi:hypothetical protein
MSDKLMRELKILLTTIRTGYDYNPGDSDLDSEQPIHVRLTLGDYRKAGSLLRQLEDKQP